MTITQGWDSHAWIDGPWIHRSPRRPEVRPRLLAEATLLPWLAPQLPLPVPVPERTEDGVRHLLLPGTPLSEGGTAMGRELGVFLKALHAVDPAEAVAHGALDAVTGAAEKAVFLDECRDQIVPLLPPGIRTRANELLDRVAAVRTALVHCDFGPDHILVADGRITGIIDWTDAVIGDPALDLAWVLDGAPPAVAEGVAQIYQPGLELRERSLDWYRLGPWSGVHRGLVLDIRADVERGLSEIPARL